MGKALIINGADFSSVSVDKKQYTDAQYVEPYVQGVINDAGELFPRADRVSSQLFFDVASANRINIDLEKYSYVIVYYADETMESHISSLYTWCDSESLFKTFFEPPVGATKMKISLKLKAGGSISPSNMVGEDIYFY